jgi:two-component system C4-dicarboxylate transport sensor histidine kinase DctB
VFAEPIRLEQVLINLLQNAVDAVQDSERKRVTLSIEEQDEAVSIAVTDSGAGISAADLPRLFEPFFSTKTVGQGMGLGLSISYSIVSAMGGSLRAANDPKGGARFVVGLRPAGEPSEERARYG